MQFSSLGSSKMELSETDFFDTLTIQNEQISYVKHILAPLYVFFTLFGHCFWGGGGGSQGGWGTTCLCNFTASAAQTWLSLSPLRGALPKAIEFAEMRCGLWDFLGTRDNIGMARAGLLHWPP